MLGSIHNCIAVDVYRLCVEKLDGITVYRRYAEGSTATERHLIDVEIVELVPMYPVYIPKFITQYILCILDKELVVAPGKSVKVYLSIPIDYAVYARSGQSFAMIDVFTLDRRPKYILYGPTDHGVVARLCRVSVSFTPIKPGLGYAVSMVIVRNSTKDIVKVKRILLDASPLRLFYVPGTWRVYTQKIVMNIDSQSTATVIYSEPFISNAVAIDDPPDLRPPKICNRTDMLWGF